MSRAWRRRSASCPSSEGGPFGERRTSGNPGGSLSSLQAARNTLRPFLARLLTMQHDSGKPEWENLRRGSADEPFNREISAGTKN